MTSVSMSRSATADASPAAGARAAAGAKAAAATENLRIRMPDGVELAARVIEPPGAAIATALLLHGNGLHSGYYVPFARLLATHGIRMVLADQRGHGQSGGERGHIDQPMQYADDAACCIGEMIGRYTGPLFVLGHSAGAAILLKASAAIAWDALAGIALLTPTFAREASMVRRGSGNSFNGTRLRYMLRTRPARSVPSDDSRNRMEFDVRGFLLASLFGIGKRRPVLTYIPSLAGEAPYTYSAAGLSGSMIGRPEAHLARVEVPVFLATGDTDIFVDDAAVHSIVPWGLRPEIPLCAINCAGGNHFTTLLHAVRPLSGWMAACVARAAS